MNFNAVSIDVGFGHTKWAVRLENEIITGSFPSLAPISSATTVSTVNATLGKRTTIKVDIDGYTFEVGPDVHLAMSGVNSGRSLSDDFPSTRNYKALIYGALYYAGVDNVDILTLGLPVHTMSQYADLLKEIFKAPVVINDRKVTVGRVIVLPQPVGSLAKFGADHMEDMKDKQTRLVIDIGYVTTDWVVASGFDMIDGRSGGRIGGVSHILKQVSEQISAKYSPGTKFDRIERIDEALVSGRDLKYFRHNISKDELDLTLLSARPIIEETVKEIKTRVGEVDDLNSILLAGGGARFFEPVIRSTFPMNDVYVMSNPTFTNAEGFLVVGETVLRRSKKHG